MPEEKYTRCPGCATVFRVTSEQLAMRAGHVRCGHCKKVFDANAHRVAPAPPRAAAAPAHGDGASPGPAGTTAALHDAPAPEAPPAASRRTEITYDDRSDDADEGKTGRARALLYGTVSVLLAALITAQAVYHYRDAIAAHWPATQPALSRICGYAGCAIRPLRDPAMSYLSIDASDLQADSAHRGLLILTATLRNRAAWSLAYPHLELTLTDAQDAIVVRRALAPADYTGGTTDLQRGIPPNGEVAVKVFIDASATTQAGYRLYMFYP